MGYTIFRHTHISRESVTQFCQNFRNDVTIVSDACHCMSTLGTRGLSGREFQPLTFLLGSQKCVCVSHFTQKPHPAVLTAPPFSSHPAWIALRPATAPSCFFPLPRIKEAENIATAQKHIERYRFFATPKKSISSKFIYK